MGEGDDHRPERCLACAEPLRGLYCHACGQGHRYPRLRLRAMVGDVVEGLVELDSRVLRTAWGLTVRPGRVAREYLDGRRIVYINPFKYALVAVTLAYVIIPWVAAKVGLAGAGSNLDGPQWARLLNIFALPITATAMALLFWTHRLRWIEHLVVVLYVHGHTFVLQTVLGVALLLVAPEWSVLLIAIPVGWLGWTAHEVTGAGWISSMVRSGLAFGAVILLVYLLRSVVMGAG